MAAHSGGHLQRGEQRELEAHLETCPGCAERSRELQALAALLRQADLEPTAGQLARAWNHVSARQPLARPREAALSVRTLLPVAVALALVVGVVLWLGRERPASTDQTPEHRTASRTPQVKHEHDPGPFTVLAAGGTTADGDAARAGQRITAAGVEVGRNGILWLSRRRTTVIAAANTRMKVRRKGRGGGSLELRTGAVHVITSGHEHENNEPQIVVGAFVVRPQGTAYSVDASDRRQPEVSVYSGRVLVEGPRAKRSVAAGERWSPRGKRALRGDQVWARKLSAARQLAERTGDRLAGVLYIGAHHRVEVAGQLFDRTPVELLLPVGELRLTEIDSQGRRTERRVAIRSDQRAELGGQPPASAPASPSQPHRQRRQEVISSAERHQLLREIEQDLAAGRIREARQKAIAALPRVAPGTQRLRLELMIADSWLQSRAFRRAADLYRRIWRRGRRSQLAGQALFSLASLQAEKLDRPRLAARSFQRYLVEHPRGAHSEEARYLSCRALRRAGQRAAARRCAERYLKSHRQGRFRQQARDLLRQ